MRQDHHTSRDRSMRLALAAAVIALLAAVPASANSLQVNASAAMGNSVGTACGGSPCGLQVNVTNGDTSEAYVESTHPASESLFRTSFYVNPGNLTISPTVNLNHFIFLKMYRSTQPQAQHTFVYIKRNNRDDAYRMTVMTRLDNGNFVFAGEFFLGADPTPPDSLIEIEWKASSGPGMNDGYVQAWRNGSLRIDAQGLDNDTYNVDTVRMGLPPGNGVDAGTFGSFYLDEYVSTR